MIGYARCLNDDRDVALQRSILAEFGIPDDRILIDRGSIRGTGGRPGLDGAIAATGAGDTLAVPSLARLARSITDAAKLGERLAARGTALAVGGRRYDPNDPAGELFFGVLADVARIDADLAKLHTLHGIAIARSKGKTRGKPAKLTAKQQDHVVALFRANRHTVVELANLFNVSRSSIYRVLDRRGVRHDAPEDAGWRQSDPRPIFRG